MDQVGITKNDELVMMLLHYFITEQGYSPIVLQGAQNEIWLENLDQDYRIVRIVTDYIHNDEQFKYDIFKTQKISKKIKKKLMSLKMNVLNLYLNLGDNVDFKESEMQIGRLTCVLVNTIEDVKNSESIIKNFPTITKETDFKEKGLELFMKLTTDINAKNTRDARQAEDVFTTKKPVVTYLFIITNVLSFLAMYLFGNGSQDIATLLKFGANYRPFVLDGEVWRLFTCAFLHIGVLHLIVNMYALYVIGPQLENFFGKWKYLCIYFISAISGSLLSITFSTRVSAGASGAIFGLLGALLYFGYHYRVYLGNIMKSQIIPIILLNLGIGFIVSGIDNAAHIGGLVAGIFTAMAVGVKYKSNWFDCVNGIIVTIIYLGFLMFMAFAV